MANCETIQPELSAYLDGEVSPADRAAVETHVRDCSACREALKDLESARNALNSLPRLKAPKSLAAAIRRGIAEGNATPLSAPASAPSKSAPHAASFEPRRRTTNWRPVLMGLAAMVMAAVLIFLLLPQISPQSVQKTASSEPTVAARKEKSPDTRTVIQDVAGKSAGMAAPASAPGQVPPAVETPEAKRIAVAPQLRQLETSRAKKESAANAAIQEKGGAIAQKPLPPGRASAAEAAAKSALAPKPAPRSGFANADERRSANVDAVELKRQEQSAPGNALEGQALRGTNMDGRPSEAERKDALSIARGNDRDVAAANAPAKPGVAPVASGAPAANAGPSGPAAGEVDKAREWKAAPAAQDDAAAAPGAAPATPNARPLAANKKETLNLDERAARALEPQAPHAPPPSPAAAAPVTTPPAEEKNADANKDRVGGLQDLANDDKNAPDRLAGGGGGVASENGMMGSRGGGGRREALGPASKFGAAASGRQKIVCQQAELQNVVAKLQRLADTMGGKLTAPPEVAHRAVAAPVPDAASPPRKAEEELQAESKNQAQAGTVQHKVYITLSVKAADRQRALAQISALTAALRNGEALAKQAQLGAEQLKQNAGENAKSASTVEPNLAPQANGVTNADGDAAKKSAEQDQQRNDGGRQRMKDRAAEGESVIVIEIDVVP